ncbi:HD-GYP domain-containing protein [Aneurinibacillus sp. Ricciae_BoGa-3]|uniref:HD-GYP domain-containing protein n=1 Tax=Aneurinibacillus sp. Ricciae_BoGa-3 TaxID=3022697 RepID=UPI00233FCE39|nr:HD-GYP domain-containing protein [Aneurinibacillus sp. Ricciae_BoGa-3]WCK54176.1 HD-GYP domain-containing protein [Aneurinibacillus sp. Ricciae_BoGa-3]
MPQAISYELIGQILETDIYNEQGILLLSAGKSITATDLDLLLNSNVHEVSIREPVFDNLSEEIMDEIHTVWAYNPVQAGLYKKTLSQIKQLFLETKTGNPPNTDEITRRFSPLVEQALETPTIIHPLQSMKGKDEITFRHSINVGIFSALIGRLLYLPDEACLELGEAGLVHDIGKMLIPDAILNKESELTREEEAIMRKHTQHGHTMLLRVPDLPKAYSDVALFHHERMDGSGYPFGLTRNNIPLSAQVVAVADKFDALSSDRPYHKKLSPFKACTYLNESQFNGRLNPEIVTPFISFVLKSYTGATVRLSTGEEGVIVLHNEQEPLRPLVKVENDVFVELKEERDIYIEELLV